MTLLICPNCEGPLNEGGGCFVCQACKNEVPVIKGVIDLRTWIDPIDQGAVDHLLKVYEQHSHLGLADAARPVTLRLRRNSVPEKIERWWEKKRFMAEELGGEAFDVASIAIEMTGHSFKRDAVLDMGSGMGALLPTLSENFGHVYAVELSLKNQLIAKKFIEEKGLDNITLVAGAAENRHFVDSSFDLVIMNNVIEHVSDVDKVLGLCRAYLKPGGVICFDSGNRYNLFFYEPHTHLWGVGFMPRKYMVPFVRIMNGMRYDNVRLLSYFELKRYLRRYFPAKFGVIITPLHPKRVRGLVKRVFEQVRRIPVVSDLAKLVVPSLYAVATK